MKITSLYFLFILFNIELSANENWINIEAINVTQSPKQHTRLDINISQIAPINKILKNVTVVKQLIDTTSKEEKVTTHSKNWFTLNHKGTK